MNANNKLSEYKAPEGWNVHENHKHYHQTNGIQKQTKLDDHTEVRSVKVKSSNKRKEWRNPPIAMYDNLILHQ